MTNAIQETGRLGQSIWYDNVRRGLIVSGDLARLIDSGVSGLTSNPTIFEKAIAGSADYDDALSALAEQGATIDETYEALTIDDIRMVADLLRPLYERTGGADGYASLEVSPDLAHDTEGSIEEARRLFKMLERPNAMIKIPATPAGMPAIRQLIGEGINVNVTLIFSLAAYRQVIESYLAGLEQLAQSGGDVSRIASVASFFLSRVDTVVDAQLQERIDAGATDLEPLLGRAAIANAQKAYGMFKDIFESERFAPLKEKQARAQRPLWASTSAKNPAYDELHYVEPLIGPHTVNTLPPNTMASLLEKGQPEARLTGDTSEAEEVLDGVAKAGVDMDAVTDKLLADGVASFIKSFDTLKQNIADKLALLQSAVAGADGFLAGLGTNRPAVEDALDLLDADHVMGRILAKDHTVWRDDPTEIADRLGWLDAPETMAEHAEALAAFADEIRAEGFQHAVLLGMGGSSLGPEVLRRSFDPQDGYPSLIVLDSTTPAWVRSVSDAIDPARTLFIVSSKSGSTTEVHAFYRYFRGLVEAAVGAEPAGAHFIAVTDSGTPLERLAKEEGFRRLFINPADFGGRYSVLSYFGLAPAALMGLDAGELLARASRMRGTAGAPAAQNPAALLGAAMGALAREGRDKLTLLTGPGLEGYGLWVEQLLAESTGKDGEGIIPVDGEPLLEPAAYGSDRLFVYPRMQDQDNRELDEAASDLAKAGHPVLRLHLNDAYDLGAEFFRWELAAAVAGRILNIQPFDQPNVQQAKDATKRLLDAYADSGALPEPPETPSLDALLAGAKSGDYAAIQVYGPQNDETDDAVAALRRRIAETHKIATTAGYGPRYLHSTGQLHKGGPASGIFLQFEPPQGDDIPIPGEGYSFGVLAKAQALGDLQALLDLGRRAARIEDSPTAAV